MDWNTVYNLSITYVPTIYVTYLIYYVYWGVIMYRH